MYTFSCFTSLLCRAQHREDSLASSSTSLLSYRQLTGDATVGLGEDSELDGPGFASSPSEDSLAFDQTQIGVSQWLREVESETGTLRARNPDPASASPSQDLPSSSHDGNQSRWSHSTDSLAQEGPPNDFSFWDQETESETGSPPPEPTGQSISSSGESTPGEASGNVGDEDTREPPQVDWVTFGLLVSRDDGTLARLRGDEHPDFRLPTSATLLGRRATWYGDETGTARAVEVYEFGPGDATVVHVGASSGAGEVPVRNDPKRQGGVWDVKF
ncbi:hypothetical protein JMJ77_0006582 [Colletotrichum scovillei]|uniref:Uncharacterized protein n=1 Tax=Colletotrichum scovillei TaxID=1209932 RepID=A0A9P7UIE2_9PEZI|nr:hypothetical protein JMJ77_0006582 [Colletotrichum scovillei]KAG7077760.1 hypothetical protein JMJ76_0015004 [Colletotrichum scovillei]